MMSGETRVSCKFVLEAVNVIEENDNHLFKLALVDLLRNDSLVFRVLYTCGHHYGHCSHEASRGLKPRSPTVYPRFVTESTSGDVRVATDL
jgi:hypothetical protein